MGFDVQPVGHVFVALGYGVGGIGLGVVGVLGAGEHVEVVGELGA